MLAKTPSIPEIVREFTAERANALFNHEAVRPWILLPEQETLDLSDFIADPRNLVLMNEPGTVGIACHRLEDGVFEVHTAALPEARGPAVLAFVRAAIGFLFAATDAMELLTRCPVHNPPAEALAQAVGGTLEFERPAAWETDKGPVAVRYYALRYPEWARTAPELPALGQWFHDRLEAENERLGIPGELHDDDPSHDRYVGAAVVMILSGQPVKGVILYNRWARLAGYGLASIANADPLIVDIGSHVLRVHPEHSTFEVLSCPQAQ